MGLLQRLSGTLLDQFKIGKGTSGNKSLIANNTATNKPELRYDDSAKVWKVSDDGSVFNGITTKSVADLNVYANSVTGNDSNDGLSSGTAKQSLSAVMDLVPSYITANVIVNLDGTFSSSIDVHRMFARNGSLKFYGGTGTTNHSTYNGTYSITGSGSDYIDISGVTLPTDGIRGWWIKDSGSSTFLGLVRTNTASRIYFAQHFFAPPASINIVRPSTRLTGTLKFYGCVGGLPWTKSLIFQNLQFYSNNSLEFYDCSSISMWGVMADFTSDWAIIFRRCGMITLDSYWADESARRGLSLTSGGIWVDKSGLDTVSVSVIKYMNIDRSYIGTIGRGTWFKRLRISNSSGGFYYPDTYFVPDNITGDDSQYYITEISDEGLFITNSQIGISGDVSIKNSSGHAIYCSNSELRLNKTDGSGSSGLGVYAPNNSIIEVSGTVPTITGTVGDFGATSETQQDSTWADIFTNNRRVSILSENTLAKKAGAISEYSAPGIEQTIAITITATAGNFDSTTKVPRNSIVQQVITNVTSAYDGSATIEVKVNGGTPVTVQATTENTPSSVNRYDSFPCQDISSSNTGVVRVVLGGSPTTGAAKVYVKYLVPLT